MPPADGDDEPRHRSMAAEVAAAEHVERQVAVAVVVAVEEPPLLVAVQRVVGGVEIEHDLLRRLRVRVEEEVHEQRLDRRAVVGDPAVAVGFRGTGSSRYLLWPERRAAAVRASSRPNNAPSRGRASRGADGQVVGERDAATAPGQRASSPSSGSTAPGEAGRSTTAASRGTSRNYAEDHAVAALGPRVGAHQVAVAMGRRLRHIALTIQSQLFSLAYELCMSRAYVVHRTNRRKPLAGRPTRPLPSRLPSAGRNRPDCGRPRRCRPG